MEEINISESFALLRKLQTSKSQVLLFYFLKKEQKHFNFDPSRFMYIIQKANTNFKKSYMTEFWYCWNFHAKKKWESIHKKL